MRATHLVSLIWNMNFLFILLIKWVLNKERWLTRTTTSLAARAIISAHDTRPGHWASTASLALFTVSKPSPARDILSCASFSASPLSDVTNTEASHPYTATKHTWIIIPKNKHKKSFKITTRLHTPTKQSWKNIRNVAGAVMVVCWYFVATAWRTISSTLGHVEA